MKIIGITGGVGAGKSTVLDYLEKEFNACVLQADKIGHLVMEHQSGNHAGVDFRKDSFHTGNVLFALKGNHTDHLHHDNFLIIRFASLTSTTPAEILPTDTVRDVPAGTGINVDALMLWYTPAVTTV